MLIAGNIPCTFSLQKLKKNLIWKTRNITLKTLSFIWRKEIFVHQIFPIKFINSTTLIERATILKRLVHNSWYICTNIAFKPCKHYCKYIFYLVTLVGLLHYNDDNDYINKEAFHFLSTLPALSAFLKPGLCTMPAGDNFSNSLWRKISQSFITLEHVHTDITNTWATYWLIRLPVDTSSSTDITITHVQLTDLVGLSVDTSSSQWCICLATDSSHSPPLVVTVLQSV